MLILSRKCNETIRINDNIVIRINKLGGNRVVIGIEAPRDIKVVRGELSDPHTPLKGLDQ